MDQDSKRISELWRKEFSDQVNKYSQFRASEQFQQVAALFSPGRSYYYILNFHNVEPDFISPSAEEFVGIPSDEISMEDLLRTTLPEEVESLKKKEKVIKDFYWRYLDKEEMTSYKLISSYRMKDYKGKVRSMLHQATPLSVSENGTPQHVLSVHTDISHLKVSSTPEVSFIHLKGGKSYYNIDPKKGFFDPKLAEAKKSKLYENISSREKEVIRLLAKGYETKNIAEELNLSVHTVSTHRKNILQKSGCNNTSQLVAKCITGGVLSQENL